MNRRRHLLATATLVLLCLSSGAALAAPLPAGHHTKVSVSGPTRCNRAFSV